MRMLIASLLTLAAVGGVALNPPRRRGFDR
jgi:hypothetical protein